VLAYGRADHADWIGQPDTGCRGARSL